MSAIKRKAAIPPLDASALLYAGWLGHSFVIIADDGKGGRRCPYQCNDVGAAHRYAREHAAEHCATYEQIRKGEWRPR